MLLLASACGASPAVETALAFRQPETNRALSCATGKVEVLPYRAVDPSLVYPDHRDALSAPEALHFAYCDQQIECGILILSCDDEACEVIGDSFDSSSCD